jgi:hypothetical protein
MAGRKARPLTEAMILAWADSHFARTGGWPGQRSGPADGAGRLTWHYIDDALRWGRCGLPGGDSLARLLDRHRRRKDRS